jgi:phosphatidylserine/phosphatidylglycerophosphate/cardiolipin synthase-like enzyme
MPSRRQTYVEAVISAIDESRETLFCVSPYIDTRGIGVLFTHLMNALARGVKVTIISHDALDPTSFTGLAVEELRREARRANGELTIYSADAGSGQDRGQHPLLHAKLVVTDKCKVIVGSGNLTSYAFSTNLEAGTVLGTDAAEEAITVISHLITSNIVYLVFVTGQRSETDTAAVVR